MKLVFQSYRSSKLHWSTSTLPVLLEVGPAAIVQKDVTSGNIMASYDYKDIEKLTPVSDCDGGFVIISTEFGRQVRDSIDILVLCYVYV